MDGLVTRLNEALKLQSQQQATFDLLTSELPAEDIVFWEHLCKQWHNAPHPKDCIFNPCQSVSPCTSKLASNTQVYILSNIL